MWGMKNLDLKKLVKANSKTFLGIALIFIVLLLFWWPALRVFVIKHPGIIGVLVAVSGEVYFDWEEETGRKGRWKKFFMGLLVASLAYELYEAAETDKEAANAIKLAGNANERAAKTESSNLVLRTNIISLEIGVRELAHLYDQSTNALAEANSRLSKIESEKPAFDLYINKKFIQDSASIDVPASQKLNLVVSNKSSVAALNVSVVIYFPHENGTNFLYGPSWERLPPATMDLSEVKFKSDQLLDRWMWTTGKLVPGGYYYPLDTLTVRNIAHPHEKADKAVYSQNMISYKVDGTNIITKSIQGVAFAAIQVYSGLSTNTFYNVTLQF